MVIYGVLRFTRGANNRVYTLLAPAFRKCSVKDFVFCVLLGGVIMPSEGSRESSSSSRTFDGVLRLALS